MTSNQDHVYDYDGLSRLKTFDEGKIASGSIATPLEEQDWMLDAVGNWASYAEATGGTATLNQSRSHNKVNEITGITAAMGTPVWIDPVHDLAGNMTTIPNPKSLATGLTATYDAWNRMASVTDGTLTYEHEYDGLNRRIVKTLVIGTFRVGFHYYYNTNWQVLETRVESGGVENPNPVEQMVWHPYYIDALATRFYDPDADGNNVRK